jgi:hypothetical protein
LLMEFWVSWNFVIPWRAGVLQGSWNLDCWFDCISVIEMSSSSVIYYTWEGPCYQEIYTLDLGCWLWLPRHNDLTGGPSPIQNIANVHDTRINTKGPCVVESFIHDFEHGWVKKGLSHNPMDPSH